MSPSTSDLFAAARGDAPSDVQHDAMWERVATATGVAAAGSATATAVPAAAAKTAGAKLLAVGGVIGAAATAFGVVVATTVNEPSGTVASRASSAPAQVAHGVGAKLAEPRPRAVDPSYIERRARAEVTASVAMATAAPADPSELLAAEAKLVTEARRALVGGDPARALTTVRRTKSLAARALEPEELNLEARALAALGRVDEAAAADLELRRKYPSHALAR